MKNQNLLDQFFLVDREVIEEMISSLKIGREDTVLEIGAGTGILTRKLAETTREIIAVEIDKKFQNELRKIQGDVRLIFDDALDVIKGNKVKFNKLAGSLPSSIIEPLMHVLVKRDFKLAVFLVPLKFAFKLTDSNVLNAFFETEILKKISRKSFSPRPKTNWAIIRLTKKSDPLKTGERERFLRQFVYEHPRAKLKNALVEGLVRFYKFQRRTLTKNQARGIVSTENPLQLESLQGVKNL